MTRGRPSIEAEQYAVPGKPGADGKLELHSFRYEVFDLPALVGHTEQCHDAGEIMTVAASTAGTTFQRFAENRITGDAATQEELDALNAEMAKMADRLADALVALTDASWWLKNESRFTPDDAYDLIVRGGEALQSKS